MGKRIPRLQMWPFSSGNFDCSFYTPANFYLGEVQARFRCCRICPGPSSPRVKLSGLQISKVVLFLRLNPPHFPGLCGARFSSKVLEKVDAGPASSGHPFIAGASATKNDDKCPVTEIAGILPEVSRLFFKARSEPDWR